MRIPRAVLILLSVAHFLSLACATWKAQEGSPAEVLSTPRDHVRLTMSDGKVHAVHDARIEGDRVVGTRPASATAGSTPQEISFPLADVRKVEVSKTSAGRSLALGAGVYLGIALVVGVIAVATLFE